MQKKFSSEFKLQSSVQFKRVFENKRKVISEYFGMFYRRNDCNHPRLGISVAKKNIHHATQRNYFKRIVRESFRLHQDKFDAFDIVVLVFHKAENTASKELWQCLEKQWEKLILQLKKA